VQGGAWVGVGWWLRRLWSAEAELRQVIEAAPDAMIIVKSDGTLALLNTQAVRLFGYSREELIGRPVEDLVPPRFRSKHTAHRGAFAGAPRTREMGGGLDLCGLRRNGTEFPVEISLSPLRLAAGSMVCATIRDVSERKRAEHARREIQERLAAESMGRVAAEEASRMKSTFLGLISHEVRTPLASMGVNLRLLMSAPGKVTPEAQIQAAAAVQRASKRLDHLVDSILEYSRLESGSVRLREEVLDLRAMVNEAIAEHSGEAGRKGLRLTGEVAPDAATLRSDGTLLRLILHNLVQNAVKYTDQGFVEVTVRGDESALHLCVRDSGPGIAPADHDRVFKPFEQLEGIDHKHRPGVGLGLALVRAHGRGDRRAGAPHLRTRSRERVRSRYFAGLTRLQKWPTVSISSSRSGGFLRKAVTPRTVTGAADKTTTGMSRYSGRRPSSLRSSWPFIPGIIRSKRISPGRGRVDSTFKASFPSTAV